MDENSYKSEDGPVLLYNNSIQGIKVHSSLVNEMRTCNAFDFSVAFITTGGLSTLYDSFRDISERKVKGRILTTDYLDFNDPDALEWLLEFTDLEIRVCEERFHTKGYTFYHGNEVVSLVGSSNLTDRALCENLEWNLKIKFQKQDVLAETIRSEFKRMWDSAVPLTKGWISDYRNRRSIRKIEKPVIPESKAVEPNAMQVEALDALSRSREDGKRRALLVSATGTGKTYISAFDVKAFAPRRFLFIVHNENILEKAMDSYRRVLGDRYTYGKFTGTEKRKGCTALFATIQTISRRLDEFPRDQFDYIVCDEAHHSTAREYSSIFGYFTPGFMLGMTATPERMDQADVFRMFDYNVVYEIRLNRALEAGLLCPFHYFGVTEISVDGKVIDDDSDFNALTSDERVRNIIEKAEYYRPHGSRTKGLVFCSTKEECRVLSEKMNSRGYWTVALTGEDSIGRREDAIGRLRADDGDILDYIIIRDVFNEGIDIPEVNQILMLRPTQSAIIFVQQLGRGLRRTDDPDKSLIVLDFIGNYENNFMIPVALSGDRSHDKDGLRRFMISSYLPGSSTVGFEKIAKERILSNINRVNLSKLAMLKGEYNLMRARLGRPPSLCDLLEGGSLDPRVVIDYANNLNRFRIKAKDGHLDLSTEEDDLLSFVSSFVQGKRPQELRILKRMIDTGEVCLDMNDPSDRSALSVLDGSYQTNATMGNHPSWRVVEERDGELVPTDLFRRMLSDSGIRGCIEDAVRCGLEICSRSYGDTDGFGFKLYGKYSRSDVCRLLNWEKDVSSTMYGYMIRNGQCPVFVTYDKRDDISSTTMYVEGFESRRVFNWMSKSNRTMASEDVKAVLSGELDILLFIKKSDSEGTDFYYMGRVEPIRSGSRETTIDGHPVVEIPLELAVPVSEDLYGYMTAETSVASDETASVPVE